MKLCVLGIHYRETCACKDCKNVKHNLIEVNGRLIERVVLMENIEDGRSGSIVRETSEIDYKCRRCDHRETKVEVVVTERISDKNDHEGGV